MKRYLIPAFCLVSSLVMADSITLKSGEELKGDVINEGPDGILIDYYVTPTIRDQRLVSRDDIVKMSVIAPDDKAYAELGSLTPPATLLDTSFHDSLIEKKIPDFLTRYPYSKHLTELRARLASLATERSRIREGDRKVEGTWYTHAQLEADPYQTTAMLQSASIKERALAGDPVAALQQYELLEKNFPGSKVFPDALDAAVEQIDRLKDRLAKARSDFDVMDKKRQAALALARADQAKELKDAIDRETATTKAAMLKSQADGTKFFPVFSGNKESLDALQTLADTERLRLVTLQKTPIRDGLKASAEASRLAEAGSLKDAQDQLAAAQKLWPANHDVVVITAQLDQKNKAAALQKTSQAATSQSKK
jgi:hypothetical protein